jgi:hypothetical protein
MLGQSLGQRDVPFASAHSKARATAQFDPRIWHFRSGGENSAQAMVFEAALHQPAAIRLFVEAQFTMHTRRVVAKADIVVKGYGYGQAIRAVQQDAITQIGELW